MITKNKRYTIVILEVYAISYVISNNICKFFEITILLELVKLNIIFSMSLITLITKNLENG